MKTIFRCSEYGFLQIDQVCEPDKAIIELAALCVDGVYGAAFIVEAGILHVIFDPEKTSLDGINRIVRLAASMAHRNLSGMNIRRADRK